MGLFRASHEKSNSIILAFFRKQPVSELTQDKIQLLIGLFMATRPDENFDEAAILNRLAKGDEEALGELYDHYGAPLFSIALKIVANRHEAEEVVQDVFTRVWRKAADFETQRGSLFGWMAVITRNLCIDQMRKSGRRLPSAPAGPQQNAVSNENTALDALCASERAAEVQKIVDSLPEDQREAIHLAFFSGLTHSEIAEKLGISLGTIKSRIRYGIQKLRSLLKGGMDA